jgi:flagellar basal body-associated protein FliL
MADDPKKKPEAAPADKSGASPAKKKKMIAGAAAGVIGLAYLLSTLAAPKKAEYKVFEGPFVAPVSGTSEFTANLADKARKRFLLLKLNAVYEGFDQAYVAQRQADPIYTALVSNAILDIASKYNEEVMNEEVGKNFLAELQRALDPLLFPVHVGKAPTPADQDPNSGLRMGTSADASTLRGSLYDHKLTVSAKEKKLRLDNGPPIVFQGTERDLRVESELGRTVFIDVTGLKPDFEGQVLVGVYGRVRELLKEKFNVQ